MKTFWKLPASLFALALLSGCETTAVSKRKEVDISTATLSDFRQGLPGKPELADYQFRLQKRIDQAFFEELRALQFAKQYPAAGSSFLITLVVRSGGNIGATDAEIKRAAGLEPVLATAAFNALAKVNEKPESFPEALKREVGDYFTYSAHFSILQ